ncbi:S9 family peptidase [Maricurvus nonylphenolicus]|uniref:S9 family peptidase n=1 Tax=Maricurvus nonylphenolicus TaxID=1008307 RepID=UPI0036F3CA0E
MANTSNTKQTAPYGSWPSVISAELLTSQNLRLAEPRLDGDTLYWLESRPQEQGRSALVRQVNGQKTDLLPPPYSIRSKAHEYGGASYCVDQGEVYVILQDDQRVYQLQESGDLKPLTPEGDFRYADLRIDRQHQRLICVREDHTLKKQGQAEEETNALVAVPLDASQAVSVLVEGDDFYSNPQISPNHQQLSWLCWNHPSMPWDNTQCYIADLDQHGKLSNKTLIAGDPAAANQESVFQPQWSPDGDLYLVSDRNNWWNLYRYRNGELETVIEKDAEFATPQWVFGMSTFGFLNSQQVLATYTQQGRWYLGLIDLQNSTLTQVSKNYSDISTINCAANQALFIGGAPDQPAQIVHYQQGELSAVAESAQLDFGREEISLPQPISFASGPDGQAQAHAFYYPPTNTLCQGPADEQPPLIVLGHGGPTGATETSFNLKIQYWTNRGFAVLDVNYRGSTGYGREYREQLKNQWGIADVEDVCAGAEYLVKQGLANPEQLAIKGSSAGGYTVLAALAFGNTFKAGTSLYGIGDLETLARDTHKFEARYLDSLVGPYPQDQATYQSRSPINHIDQLNCPAIFFQGLDDKVVPPNQAEAMVAALDNKGIPVAYVPFAGEGHGFRQGPNIQRALEAEYYFYSQVFGFEGDSAIEPVEIKNI